MTDAIDENTGTGSINTLIQQILLELPIDINKVLIYSWGYHHGTNYLEPKNLYETDIKNYRTKILAQSYFKDYNNIDICGELSQKTRKRFLRADEYNFVLQLHADEILENVYKNLVVTNVKPDNRLFPKGALHTQTGSWKF